MTIGLINGDCVEEIKKIKDEIQLIMVFLVLLLQIYTPIDQTQKI